MVIYCHVNQWSPNHSLNGSLANLGKLKIYWPNTTSESTHPNLLSYWQSVAKHCVS